MEETLRSHSRTGTSLLPRIGYIREWRILGKNKQKNNKLVFRFTSKTELTCVGLHIRHEGPGDRVLGSRCKETTFLTRISLSRCFFHPPPFLYPEGQGIIQGWKGSVTAEGYIPHSLSLSEKVSFDTLPPCPVVSCPRTSSCRYPVGDSLFSHVARPGTKGVDMLPLS